MNYMLCSSDLNHLHGGMGAQAFDLLMLLAASSLFTLGDKHICCVNIYNN